MGRFEMWDVLRVGRSVMGRFVCASIYILYMLKRGFPGDSY
jgi:hypothetical protein